MKTREIATIVLKVLAVYAFLEFLTMLPAGLGLFQMINSLREIGGAETEHMRQFTMTTGWFLIGAIVYLTLAVTAFLGAHRLARFFVSDPEDHVTLADPVSDQFMAVAFQCLGIYALVTWIPTLAQTTIRCALYGTWTDPHTPFLRRFYDNWSGLISPSMGVILGVLLVFRARGLLRLIRLARPMSAERVQMEAETKETHHPTNGGTVRR